jgi:hypothetical protein
MKLPMTNGHCQQSPCGCKVNLVAQRWDMCLDHTAAMIIEMNSGEEYPIEHKMPDCTCESDKSACFLHPTFRRK